MANNVPVIRALKKCFEIDDYDRFTNCALIFAYNGTGKTRLSYDFAHFERSADAPKHTLYYNAYTEDLFTWDNDLENNTDHRLLINQDSEFIQGLAGYEFSDKLRKYLQVFTDIDFDFLYDEGHADLPYGVKFSKHKTKPDGTEITFDNIKISRGEERLFVWCFFRCIVDQVLGDNDAYKDIEYIYIDDPISSLDDNNVILFAEQLYSVIRARFKMEVEAMKAGRTDFRPIMFIVSSHHALFFHTMLHGLNADKKLGRYYLNRDKQQDRLILKSMNDNTPFFYNVAMMSEIQRAIEENKLYTYHFTVLRSIMEKIKEFFGHKDFGTILEGITYHGKMLDKDELAEFYSRVVNVLTHQGSMFAPRLMNEDNKELATTLFNHLVKKYQFVLPDLNDYHSEAYIAAHQDR